MIESMVQKTGRASLLALLALSLGACASVGPVNQEVTLRVSEGGERVEAVCEVSNDQASWSVVSPVVFGVTRSEKPLTVECGTPDGSRAMRTFEAIKVGSMPSSGAYASYSYPALLELDLLPPGQFRSARADLPAYARIDDVSKLPRLDDEGHEGYRRFLAGESPRAFVISDKGRWVRVNAVRGAARIAMNRCQTYGGGRCRLYAVDDEVVWDPKRADELIAAY